VGICFSKIRTLIFPLEPLAENIYLPLRAGGTIAQARAGSGALRSVGLSNQAIIDPSSSLRWSAATGGGILGLVLNPAIQYCLADEPTGELDSKTTQQIY